MLHSDYVRAPHKGLRLSEDRIVGSMIKSRRTMRVYSREQGPFVPQGSGLSGPNTMSFSVQANPDELLDFSTLRLRFDYISLYNGKLASFFNCGIDNGGQWGDGGDNDPVYLFGVNNNTSLTGGGTPLYAKAYEHLPYQNWLDDGASSLLANARVKLNGQTIEDITRFNILDHFLVYFTASRDWLFTNGMMAGYYLDYMVEGGGGTQTVSGTLFNNTLQIDKGNQPGYSHEQPKDFPFPLKQAALGATFTIPLCGLGIGRSRRYWPVLGTVLTLEFDLETWERCHAMTQYFTYNNQQNTAGIPPIYVPGNIFTVIQTDDAGNSGPPFIGFGYAWNLVPSLLPTLMPTDARIFMLRSRPVYQTGGYQLSNAQVWVDALRADDSLLSSMRKLLRHDAVGYSVPFETFETVRYDMSQAGVLPGNTLDLRGQISCQDLVSIAAVFKNQSMNNDYTVPYKTNTFEFPYLRWSSWVVGGQQYPAFQTGVTTVSGASNPYNNDALTLNGPLWADSLPVYLAPIEPALLLNSGATEWFALTRESLGLGSINDLSSCGFGVVNPYTFVGRTGVSFTSNVAWIRNNNADAEPAQVMCAAFATNNGQSYAPAVLTNTLPPRFVLGQALEVAPDSKTGIDTMNSSNEFVLRIGIDANPNLASLLAAQQFEVLFYCRYNAAVVFSGGAMSVRK